MKITVRVHPNSKEFKIIKKSEVLHVYLTQPADKNKANMELIKEFSKKYGSCRIIKGKTSKTKILEIPPKD